jgi:VanZ family protein
LLILTRSSTHGHVKPVLPLLVMVLALTAIPVELRPGNSVALSWDSDPLDLIANFVGYIPVGVVLTALPFVPAMVIAGSLTVAAETAQIFTMHRFPSYSDVVLNVSGALAGWYIARALGFKLPALTLNRRTARAAALLALAILTAKTLSDRELIASQWSKDRLQVNSRGALSAGALEARWTFDNSSGGSPPGTLRNGAHAAEGLSGSAIQLDGNSQHVDFGSPVDLHLMGSITISAWINPASFPVDDAAIVSARDPGYQLDTTIDQGPRTIGFKLTDWCGNLMARYGRTELAAGKWYHIAGVYDSDARTLHVYLNGREDDGILRGPVTGMQQASGGSVLAGRRPNPPGYGFDGRLDEVRIYSQALTPVQIEAVMKGEDVGGKMTGRTDALPAAKIASRRLAGGGPACYQPTRYSDAEIPGVMVAIGMLLAIAWAGLRSAHNAALLTVGAAAGVLLVPAGAMEGLPSYVLWMIPVLTLTGAASIAFAIDR